MHFLSCLCLFECNSSFSITIHIPFTCLLILQRTFGRPRDQRSVICDQPVYSSLSPSLSSSLPHLSSCYLEIPILFSFASIVSIISFIRVYLDQFP